MTNQSSTIVEASNSARVDDLKAFDEAMAGVKGMVDAGMEKVPSMFVRPMGDRSKDVETSTENISVPVIDFALVGANDDQIIKEMILASKEWGFFQVVNHGIPVEFLETLINKTRMFHDQDVEAKKQYYSRDFISKRVIYFSNHDLYNSSAANWRDSLYVNTLSSAGELDPQELPPICRDEIWEYINHIHKLGDGILKLLSIGLGLEPECLRGMVNGTKGWSLIVNYYPPCPEPELTIGTNGHADNSFITILLQDQIGGLQVLHDNKWVNIEPVTGALIVNFGIILEIISNNKLKSAYHRVITKRVGPRLSIAFFFRGHYFSEKKYGPLEELVSEENPPIYRGFTIQEINKYFLTTPLTEFTVDHFKLAGRP